MENTNKPKRRSRVHFPEIHPSAWEHPADTVALKSLQNVPGLDTVIRFFFGSTAEKSLKLMALASSVRVSEKQFSHLYQLYIEVCETLDTDEMPELYVSQNPFLNAGAVGMDHPFIILNSSMIDTLDDEEIMAVLGHELAHIMSGHVLYKTVLAILMQFSIFALSIPVSGVVLMGIIAALSEWDRKSELSADRAGLLVCQNPETSVQLLMKLAGGRHIDQMDLGEFLKQGQEYKSRNTVSDSIHKVMNTWRLSHPFPVVRVTELMDWVQSGEYDTILRGEYRREASAYEEDFRKARQSYAKDFRENVSPAYEDFKKKATEASQKAKDVFGNMFP